MLRFSTSRQIDGLWIGVFNVSEPDTVLCRIEEALGLIKAYDPLRYDRLIRDLERVWARLLPGYLGNFNSSLRACELDKDFVLDDASLPELIAATIVHEATHARLQRCGVGYEEELRPRVEAICFRRELAFAAKLPNGEKVREQAERLLALCATEDYWTDAAFKERDVNAARDLGFPGWFIRAILGLRALSLRVGHVAERIRRISR